MYKEIVEEIKNNQILLIAGDTGCGKTTQVPQFILDDAIERKCASTCYVVCTQPRRISAISVCLLEVIKNFDITLPFFTERLPKELHKKEPKNWVKVLVIKLD